MREPVWASGLAAVKIKRENLKRETRWASGLAVVDLAALSWVAALGWMVGASWMRSVGTPLEMLESRE